MGTVGKANLGGGAESNTTPVEYIDFDSLTHDQRRALVSQMQAEMGQTGFEAGDPDAFPDDKVYVKTSKAYNINYYLNTDGASINSRDSNWQRYGYTVADAQRAITQIDNGMKPSSQNIIAHRYITASSLGRIVGQSISASGLQTMIQTFKSNPSALAGFNDTLKRVSYTQKAYTSLSYRKGHSTFDAYPVRLEFKIKQGTPIIMTNNHAEHEVLGARQLSYKLSNARIVSEYSQASKSYKDYFVIDVEV